jgi:hypothetical protein
VDELAGAVKTLEDMCELIDKLTLSIQQTFASRDEFFGKLLICYTPEVLAAIDPQISDKCRQLLKQEVSVLHGRSGEELTKFAKSSMRLFILLGKLRDRIRAVG